MGGKKCNAQQISSVATHDLVWLFNPVEHFHFHQQFTLKFIYFEEATKYDQIYSVFLTLYWVILNKI